MNVKGLKGHQCRYRGAVLNACLVCSDLFQIARTRDFIMTMCSFTTVKTCLSLQVVVSVNFSFSSFNLGTCSREGGCKPHVEGQCRPAGAAGTS